jgi:hypothetical protein
MSKGLEIGLIVLGVIVVLGLVSVFIVRPWYMRWGASDAEVGMTLLGDNLKPAYEGIYTRAITIQAPPEKIYPWLAQMGQGKGGLYSIEFLENLVGLEMKNADMVHPEWQAIQVGDLVRMGPDGKAPPAYQVAQIFPNQALILGHPGDNGAWFDTWQFVLRPVDATSTRLIVRSRYDLWHNFFDVVTEPIAFLMCQSMMNGIKERAEK